MIRGDLLARIRAEIADRRAELAPAVREAEALRRVLDALDGKSERVNG